MARIQPTPQSGDPSKFPGEEQKASSDLKNLAEAVMGVAKNTYFDRGTTSTKSVSTKAPDSDRDAVKDVAKKNMPKLPRY